MQSFLVKKSVRATLGLGMLVTLGVLASGCAAADSFTGDRSMRWVGEDLLPKEPMVVPEYVATAALPHLTAAEAASRLGQQKVIEESETEATGKGWTMTVRHSDFATSVRYGAECGALTEDTETALTQGRAALAALGLDPDDWAWFALTDSTGAARAIAEPVLEGVQTWSTGSVAVLVDEAGVCAFNGVLMAFEEAPEGTRLPSAYEVFQDARHVQGLAIEGDYSHYEQTWTLVSDGRLSPLWRFVASEHAIVAADMGDGLETALDTESSLREALRQGSLS